MRLRSRQAAMTLLEVLVALIVFSVGALGVLGMVTITLQLNQNSRQTTEATQLGIRQMERLQILQSGADANFTSCGTRCWLNTSLGRSTSAVAMQPSNLLGGTAAGSTLFYQVSWRATTSSGMRYFEVDVHWPKNRNVAATDWTSTIDCQTNPQLCFAVQFHSYRPLSP